MKGSAIKTNATSKFKITKRELLLEDIFYSLTNIVKDAIIVADSYRKIVFWNKAAAKIFNYTSVEILGKSVGLIIPQDLLNSNDTKSNNKLKKNIPANKLNS